MKLNINPEQLKLALSRPVGQITARFHQFDPADLEPISGWVTSTLSDDEGGHHKGVFTIPFRLYPMTPSPDGTYGEITGEELTGAIAGLFGIHTGVDAASVHLHAANTAVFNIQHRAANTTGMFVYHKSGYGGYRIESPR